MAAIKQTSVALKPSQLFDLLVSAFQDNQIVCIVGEPGVGKSDIVDQARQKLGMDLILSHPVVEDPTVPAGLPWVSEDHQSAQFLPFGNLHRALNATTPTIWFLDDFGQASPATQAAYMQLLLARKLNGHVLPECVNFVVATNERTHKAGVSGLLEPVKSRMDAIVRLRADLDDYCDWAFKNNLPKELIGFLRQRPELLSKFEPTADLTQSPSPRSWAKCSKWIEKSLKGNLSSDLQYPAYAGCVGEGAAIELKASLQLMVNMPNLDSILKDPKKAPIPTEPAIMYAVCAGLAYKATDSNFRGIALYAQRLHEGKNSEYAALLLKDTVQRLGKDKIVKHPYFAELAKSPIGRLIITE